MSLVENLYTPREIDITRGLVPIRATRQELTSSAAAQHTFQSQSIRNEFVFLLTHWRLFSDPGAGQNIVGVSLLHREDANNAILSRLDGSSALAADATFNSIQAGTEIYVLPGEHLFVQFDYNAAVAANLSFWSLHGVLVPRANWQRGAI